MWVNVGSLNLFENMFMFTIRAVFTTTINIEPMIVKEYKLNLSPTSSDFFSLLYSSEDKIDSYI